MGRLAYIYHPLFLMHDPGDGHPERPGRLESIQNFLENSGFVHKMSSFAPEPATRSQLLLAHTASYLDFLERQKGIEYAVLDGGDTTINPYSVDAALHAAGAGVKAVELIDMEGFDKVFVAARPPGHHAEAGQALGFCLLNNEAVTAAYALDTGRYQNILIVDWDVHHGNGTQHIFYDSKQVFYLSLHRYPFFPGTGREDEIGHGDGKGFNVNIPMKGGEGDTEYIAFLEKGLEIVASRFKPDLVIISAGFDAHRQDPLGGMMVSDEGYYKLTELVARFAQKYCAGKIISFLEGGYHVDALAKSVYRHLQCLLKH